MTTRILIAEDDELQGAVLRSTFASRGYHADVVSNGLEAVRRLAAERYDLAVLDYQLPDVDGLAAARLLQGFVRNEERPGLIALTAAAGGLREKAASSGGTPFDAVVGKEQGMAALLAAIELNLHEVSERNRRAAALEAKAARRRRLRARISAVPFLIMVGAFTAAFAWSAASLHHVDAAAVAAQRASTLGADTSALVDAVQDAEASGRGYAATGQAAHRDAFMTDVARVDQMLVSRTEADLSPASAVIETRLGALVKAAEARPVAQAGAATLSVEAGREAIGQLRNWAADVVSGSQLAVFEGIEGAHRNVRIVLLILVAGALYGLWSAFRVLRQRRLAEAAPRPPYFDGQFAEWAPLVLPTPTPATRQIG